MDIHPRWLENLVVVAWFFIGTTALFAVIAWLKSVWRKKTGNENKPSLRDRLVQHGIYPTIKDDELRKETKRDDNNS